MHSLEKALEEDYIEVEKDSELLASLLKYIQYIVLREARK